MALRPNLLVTVYTNTLYFTYPENLHARAWPYIILAVVWEMGAAALVPLQIDAVQWHYQIVMTPHILGEGRQHSTVWSSKCAGLHNEDNKKCILMSTLCNIQGVQQNCSHLVICSFAGFYSCKLQKLGHLWKIQEISYKIGTRILKIDLEIAEIIEVKVATFNIEIIFLPLCNSKMSISKWWLPTLTSIISAISKSIFKILVPIM